MVNKKKILIIDDEEDFCFFVKQNLELTKEYEVVVANNGPEGINMARKDPPDLILLDMILPGMQGTEIAQVLKKEFETKLIPVVFLTAVVDREDMGVESLMESGGNYFIAKTAGTGYIINSIKKILG